MDYILALILSGLISFVLFKKYRKTKKFVPTVHQSDAPRNWNPKPLISRIIDATNASNEKSFVVVDSEIGKWVETDGKPLLNFASHNYLNLIENDRVKESAKEAIRKYGVGSCGPRGFYGTVDVHLELESRLARFTKADRAIVYSYGFSTVASAIAAYAKKNDVVFADERINFAVQRGIEASRCRVYYFKHNDTTDLERSLIRYERDVGERNEETKRKTRKFLIVEGIYVNTGKICPLPELIRIRKRFKLRLFVDESVSFGVLGSNGRGVTEYFHADLGDVDMIMATMEYALGTGGGFCVGSAFIVEHQRLAGLGYCFSASLPPFLAAAGCAAIDIIENELARISNLRIRCRELHEALITSQILSARFRLESDEPSPVKHLILKKTKGSENYLNELRALNAMVSHCSTDGFLISVANFVVEKEQFTPPASLRLTVNSKIEREEIIKLVAALERATKNLTV